MAAGVGSVWSVAFSPDGQTMATSGDDGRIQLWTVTRPEHPRLLGRPLTAGTQQVWSVAFSPVGHTLASANADGTVLLWSVADPANPRRLGPPLAAKISNPNSVSFSPDGTMLAFGGWSLQQDRDAGIVGLWDLTNVSRPRLVKYITTGTDLARATAFGPDHRVLISGNYDGTVGYWVNLHAPVRPLAPQIGGINAVAFSPDGKELAIGGGTGLELWDTSSPSHPQLGGESQSLTGYNSWITSLAFSADGTTLISGSEDDTVRLWDLSVNDAIARICSTSSGVLTYQLWQKYIPDLPYQPPCRS
jgi:WD40 repeat protein